MLRPGRHPGFRPIHQKSLRPEKDLTQRTCKGSQSQRSSRVKITAARAQGGGAMTEVKDCKPVAADRIFMVPKAGIEPAQIGSSPTFLTTLEVNQK
jgi:hypothetical protein